MQEPDAPELNPYAAPTAEVVDRVATPQLDLARPGQRLAAKIIDNFFIGLPVVAGVLLPMLALDGVDLGAEGGPMPSGGELNLLIAMASGGLMFALTMGVIIYMLNADGTTPGKRAMGVRIVSVDGSPAELWRILLLRMFTPFVINYFCGVFSLVDALFVFRRDQRCIHDHMAGTVVIQREPMARASDGS